MQLANLLMLLRRRAHQKNITVPNGVVKITYLTMISIKFGDVVPSTGERGEEIKLKNKITLKFKRNSPAVHVKDLSSSLRLSFQV